MIEGNDDDKKYVLLELSYSKDNIVYNKKSNKFREFLVWLLIIDENIRRKIEEKLFALEVSKLKSSRLTIDRTSIFLKKLIYISSAKDFKTIETRLF